MGRLVAVVIIEGNDEDLSEIANKCAVGVFLKPNERITTTGDTTVETRGDLVGAPGIVNANDVTEGDGG